MRRSGPGGGGGGGGFSKPPPAPLTHGGPGRVRLHTPEVNGTLCKDRFGSPRERSPGLVSSLPLSPSHPSSREKSPNPASQDLHDCSMCLSAYIQSLNTVCGTACRLSQCLAQVSSESGHLESYSNAGQTNTNPVREAADVWEGVARAVGVASAAVKTQMLVLLQEVQSRPDMSENSRRQEINRVTQAMLSAFLSLQYQFSAVVIERFTSILQALRDESQYVSSQNTCASSQNSGGVGFQQTNKACHPSLANHISDVSQLPVSSQYVQQLPVQPAWLPGQQQQTSSMKGVPGAPLLESPGKEDKPRSRQHSGGHSRHSSAASSWSNPSSNVGCAGTANYGSNYGSSLSMNSSNTLSPGSCYGLYSHMNSGGSSWHSDAISRRWSMGGPSAEGWERSSSLGPFSLIANRRWSVPEASEHDVMSEGESCADFYGSCGLQGEWGGMGGSASWGSRVGLHVPSRDSSVTRSPSHSRSVTPDPGRQGSFISNEELQEVIDLLSLPISNDTNTDVGEGRRVSDGGSSGGSGKGGGGRGGDGGSGNVDGGGGTGDSASGGGCGGGGGIEGCTGGGAGGGSGLAGGSGGGGSRGSESRSEGTRGTSPVGLSPTHHSSITQLFEEASKQQKQQQPQQKTQQQQQPLNSQPPQQPLKQQQQQQQPPPYQQQYREQLPPPTQYQQQQQQQYPPQQLTQHQQYQQMSTGKGCSTPRHSLGEVVVEASENKSQVSTPLWPPTGTAPGVTLTECSSQEDKPALQLWTDGIGCERRHNSSHARDAPNRASWPAASTLLWAGLDGLVSEGEDGGRMSPIGMPQYRRHSTDTTHLNLNPSSPLIAKTRSSDNITVGSDVSSAKVGCLDNNLQQLLLFNSILPASSPPTPTSQYSLFSHTS